MQVLWMFCRKEVVGISAVTSVLVNLLIFRCKRSIAKRFLSQTGDVCKASELWCISLFMSETWWLKNACLIFGILSMYAFYTACFSEMLWTIQNSIRYFKMVCNNLKCRCCWIIFWFWLTWVIVDKGPLPSEWVVIVVAVSVECWKLFSWNESLCINYFYICILHYCYCAFLLCELRYNYVVCSVCVQQNCDQ